MNLPNRLTLARIAMVPIYMVLFVAPFPFHYTAALLVFIAASITDLLDGKIARKRGLVTNLGKFLDPIADKMLTTAAFLLFLSVGVTDVWALMLILTREFMVTSVRLMAAGGGTVVAASFFGKLKTVVQYVAIISMMAALQWRELSDSLLAFLCLPQLAYSLPILVSQVFVWIAVVLTCISGVQYFWSFRQFFTEKQ